jgi:hypothetical protein
MGNFKEREGSRKYIIEEGITPEDIAKHPLRYSKGVKKQVEKMTMEKYWEGKDYWRIYYNGGRESCRK